MWHDTRAPTVVWIPTKKKWGQKQNPHIKLSKTLVCYGQKMHTPRKQMRICAVLSVEFETVDSGRAFRIHDVCGPWNRNRHRGHTERGAEGEWRGDTITVLHTIHYMCYLTLRAVWVLQASGTGRWGEAYLSPSTRPTSLGFSMGRSSQQAISLGELLHPRDLPLRSRFVWME